MNSLQDINGMFEIVIMVLPAVELTDVKNEPGYDV
jgi:hypothetical protein